MVFSKAFISAVWCIIYLTTIVDGDDYFDEGSIQLSRAESSTEVSSRRNDGSWSNFDPNERLEEIIAVADKNKQETVIADRHQEVYAQEIQTATDKNLSRTTNVETGHKTANSKDNFNDDNDKSTVNNESNIIINNNNGNRQNITNYDNKFNENNNDHKFNENNNKFNENNNKFDEKYSKFDENNDTFNEDSKKKINNNNDDKIINNNNNETNNEDNDDSRENVNINENDNDNNKGEMQFIDYKRKIATSKSSIKISPTTTGRTDDFNAVNRTTDSNNQNINKSVNNKFHNNGKINNEDNNNNNNNKFTKVDSSSSSNHDNKFQNDANNNVKKNDNISKNNIGTNNHIGKRRFPDHRRKITSSVVPVSQISPAIDRTDEYNGHIVNGIIDNNNNNNNNNHVYERENRMQAESAKYSFSSSFENSINDNSHVREEIRDGLKLTGRYSYTDGYYKRTVHYVADEKGYRVTQESVEKIGDGPIENKNGSAIVDVTVNNQDPLHYSIRGEDLKSTKNTRTPVLNARNNRNNRNKSV